MSRQAVIVDTNVVVAGLLTADDASPVARVLDGMLVAAFPFAVSEALLAEYRTVLVRPSLRKLHGLTVAEVETVLTDIAQHAIVLAPAPPRLLPTPAISCCESCSQRGQTCCLSPATNCCSRPRACAGA